MPSAPAAKRVCRELGHLPLVGVQVRPDILLRKHPPHLLTFHFLNEARVGLLEILVAAKRVWIADRQRLNSDAARRARDRPAVARPGTRHHVALWLLRFQA